MGTRSCGCRQAGVLLNAETLEVMRCDECNLFDTDEDAAAAVAELLKVLGEVYEAITGSVGDALDELERRSK